ncbi:uncharacterized protein LOC127857887 [Dreissena polymorpha]|uniref:C1q domain-containing protein n=1 Tax=Dreissena polymorpha TaxID=45954 RepID=A0A9D3YXE2_DREPO|nr:uncharacterized protein LOC127857887 [Dreissena polymorpha]KAH3706154.1 hypothetical protein DPMN_065534 [Dreissena polymorpha]
MRTILSVWGISVLFVFIHVSAVTEEEFKILLDRLSVLEEKHALSDKRIAALETENKLSHERIAVLDKYKTWSDKRIALLERKKALCNIRKDAHDTVKKLYAKKDDAFETHKIFLDKITTMHGYDTTLSDVVGGSLEKDKILSDRKILALKQDYAVSPNRIGKDDGNTAEVDITNRQSNVPKFQQRRFVAEGIVAFSAMKTATQEHIGINQNIIFGQVLTNEGGGFHPNHGVFTAPQSGVYVFSSSILTFANGEYHAAIVHNGNIVTHIYGGGDSGRHDQGSQTVVIKLNAGDEVAVQNVDKPDNNIWGDLYSSFSGFLLWPQ